MKRYNIFFIELLMVVCIISILMVEALNHYRVSRVRARIVSGLPSLTGVKLELMENHACFGKWVDKKIELDPVKVFNRGSAVDKIDIDVDGAIHLRFKTTLQVPVDHPVLTIRPAQSRGNGPGVMMWICGKSDVPEHVVVWGEDQTNIPDKYLTCECKQECL